MSEAEHIQRSSQYLAILLQNNPDFADWLWGESNIHKKVPLADLYADLLEQARGCASFNELLHCFRRFKQRHFLRIGARDLLGLAEFTEIVSQISDLACVALQAGLETLYAHPEWWTFGDEARWWPRVKRDLTLTVLGLGKLGGNELNYVSDIDLLFLRDLREEDGTEDDSGQGLVLCSKLAHWMSRLLADRFEGDRVFHVDFRLRPQGKDGVLVPSLAAAAEHYLLHGSTWERQMLLKARPVAGDRSAGSGFLQEVRPFVFRRFLDFQAIDELCAVRDRILSEAVNFRSGWRQFDVKLGVGGIREIEFLVQAFQLVYGGRHPELDEPNTLAALEKLRALDLLPSAAVSELEKAYVFLRRVEHYIQLDQNRQTQRLPQAAEGFSRLAFAMGFGDDADGFLDVLKSRCETVHAHFGALFRPGAEGVVPESQEQTDRTDGGQWEAAGFEGAELDGLRAAVEPFGPGVHSAAFGVLANSFAASGPQIAKTAITRLDRYFSRVSRRIGLKKIFETRSGWLADFCRGLASSEMFFELLSVNPSLVEVVATAAGQLPPGRQEWEAAAERLLERSRDYEETLEWIRRLKNERIAQLALADMYGAVDFATLEDNLTAVADFTIAGTLQAVGRNLGLPPDIPLSVLGLGKLGSREMSYLSDLDLVFVYDPKNGSGTDEIPPGVIRLVQRFMNMLDTPLQEGPGFSVDARLRPTGNYGPLIVTRGSWLDYYERQADIWEIQALLRARHVAGDAALGAWLESRAVQICCRGLDPKAVRGRLCHLRGRMERERSEESGETVNIKLGMGGLADIEFLVQGTLLIEGRPDAIPRHGSIREGVAKTLFEIGSLRESAEEIAAAFSTLRAFDHRLRLHTNTSSGTVERSRFEEMAGLRLWPPATNGRTLETWQDLLRLRRSVRSCFEQFCAAE